MTKDGDSNDSCVICPNVGLQNTKFWHPFGLPSCPLREFTPSDTLASWMMCNSDITITSNVCFSSITFLWSWTLQLNYNLMMGSDIGGFIVAGKSGNLVWSALHLALAYMTRDNNSVIFSFPPTMFPAKCCKMKRHIFKSLTKDSYFFNSYLNKFYSFFANFITDLYKPLHLLHQWSARIYRFLIFEPCVLPWYGYGAGNTVEENSSVFSLIRMC